MNDLGRVIRQQVRAAISEAIQHKRSGSAGPTNVAAAVNDGASSHTTAVYSDGDVTVVHRDGTTHVIRHDQDAT